MSSFTFFPLLANWVDSIGVIIVLVVAFISWLVNLSNQKNAPPPPPVRKPRPRDDALRGEIDVFLEEVSGRKPRPKPEPVAIEIVTEDEIRQRRTVKRPLPAPRAPVAAPQPKVAPKPVAPTIASRRRPGADIAERRAIDPSGLGTSVQAHVQTYMAGDRLKQEDIKRDLQDTASRNMGTLGEQRPAEQPPPVAMMSGADLVKMLRDGSGMRQAILLSEVLSRPLSRRK